MFRVFLRVLSFALAAASIAGAIAVGAMLPADPNGPTSHPVRDAGVVTDLPADSTPPPQIQK